MSGLNLSRWAVEHRSIVLYLILAIAAAGGYAYLTMGRAEDPTFTIKTMIITATWPGATAAEMQTQVADKIEKKLQELQYFDHVRTFSRPGSVVIHLNLKDTTRARDVTEEWYQARKKIADVKSTLPEGVNGPFFDDEFGDVYSAVYALTGEGYTPADLKRVAEDVRQRLLRVQDVDKVRVVGDRPEKVFVEFSHKKLATLGITPQQLFDSMARQNAVTPAGSVDTKNERVYLRVDGGFDAAERVKAVPVQSGGKLLKLGDVVEVTRGYEDPPTFLVRHNGKPAVQLAVAIKKTANVLDFGERLEREANNLKADLPVGVELHAVAFQPRVVKESVEEFLKAFGEALVIVLAVSFLSLGMRSGIVVAISVPLVLAICFVAMKAVGMNFDRITLGALIIALGLLVDDAIIAVEMMVVKMAEGWDRARAATFAWSSSAFPMLTGTLITAAGFLPVGFANSIAGEYAGNIFWVVGLALVASWFVAVIITPYLGVKLLPSSAAAAARHDRSESRLSLILQRFRPQRNAQTEEPAAADHRDQYDTRLYRLLRRFLTYCVRRPRRVIGFTALLFVAGVVGFTQVQQQFFPQSSRPELLVELRLPEGASFVATETAVRDLESVLTDDDDSEYCTAYIGAGAPRFFLALDPDLPNSSFAKVVVMTRGPEARERLRDRLQAVLRDDPRFAHVRGRVNRLDFGPPVGFPIQFRVSGPDPAVVRRISYEVRDAIRDHADIRDPHLDWDERSKMVRLVVDQDRARLLGLTPKDISDNLQTLLTGLTVSQYREGIELIDVVARAVPAERLNLDTLPDLNLITATGRAVPLAQVAVPKPGFEEPILWRRNRETTVTVRADVRDGVQAPDVTAKLNAVLEPVREGIPAGYRIEVGGSVEESEKANASLYKVFPVMILVMLTLLMLQLQSFGKVFLVTAIAPLAIIGVTVALLVSGAPFGFVALLGVISLAGMDMRNSVILIDQIKHDIDSGLSPWQAVIESTVRRARPVLLTAGAAILAMLPLSRSVFWGPMAIAIMGGLSLATFLTLVNLPAL